MYKGLQWQIFQIEVLSLEDWKQTIFSFHTWTLLVYELNYNHILDTLKSFFIVYMDLLSFSRVQSTKKYLRRYWQIGVLALVLSTHQVTPSLQ